jgi:hypothetical protein
MEDNTKVNGSPTTCMGKVSIPGRMEGDMNPLMNMIRNMDMGSMFGRMGDGMRATGSTESSMGKENTFCQMAQ